jgi:hypothetical protein
MKNVAIPFVVASAIHSVSLAAPTGQEESFDKRLENGLGRTPALGYNNWVAKSFSNRHPLMTLIIVTRTTEVARTLLQMRLSKSQIFLYH